MTRLPILARRLRAGEPFAGRRLAPLATNRAVAGQCNTLEQAVSETGQRRFAQRPSAAADSVPSVTGRLTGYAFPPALNRAVSETGQCRFAQRPAAAGGPVPPVNSRLNRALAGRRCAASLAHTCPIRALCGIAPRDPK